MPMTLKLPQDFGSVRLREGGAHRRRKGMFMSLVTPEAVSDLAERFEGEWRHRLPPLGARRGGHAVRRAGRDPCARGLRLGERAAGRAGGRAAHSGACRDGRRHGLGRPPQLATQLLRALRVLGAWRRGAGPLRRAAGIGRLGPGDIASHRDHGGWAFDVKVAAVKLISVLWPTVAVAEFIVFAALALHERPELKDRVREDDGAFLDAFERSGQTASSSAGRPPSTLSPRRRRAAPEPPLPGRGVRHGADRPDRAHAHGRNALRGFRRRTFRCTCPGCRPCREADS
jgi:fatty-acid peroxygenase